jgi:hypothetical protein
MAINNQIVGGNFTDSQGAVLANGYLLFQLSQDEQSPTPGQVAAGRIIRVDLDNTGNVPSSPAVYMFANDALTPTNSYYSVRAYTASGQLVWGPQQQQVLSSPSPFNLSAWIPNSFSSGSAPATAIALLTDGTLNSSQTRLNLESGDNISLSDDGSGNIGVNMRYPITDENGNQVQSDQVMIVATPPTVPGFETGNIASTTWRNPPLPDPQFAQFSLWNQNGAANTSPYFAASATWQNMDALGAFGGATGFTASQTSPDTLMGYARKWLLSSNAGHVQITGNAWINLHRDGAFEANILGEVGVNDYRWYLGLSDAFADASTRDPSALSTAGASSMMFFYNKDVSVNIQFAVTDGLGGWSISDTGVPFSTSAVTKLRFTWDNTTHTYSFFVNGVFKSAGTLFGTNTPDGSRNMCICAAFGGTSHGTGTGIRVGMLYGQNQH